MAIATAVAVLVGLGALGGSLGSGASHLRTELAVARRALSDLNGHVAGLKWHNDVLNGQITSLQGQVATLRGQVNSLTSTNSFLRGQLASLRGQLATLLAHRPLPNVVGQTLDAIQSLASRYGWSLHIGKQPSSQPQGTVLSQFPKPGTVMSQGASFSVVEVVP